MNLQSLLSERRSLIHEQRHSDPTARAMLQFRIDQIDRELHEQRQAIPVVRPEHVGGEWSPAQHVRAA